MNGRRWGYRSVYEGPKKSRKEQDGTIAFDGEDTLHFHTKDGVANASPEDIVNLHKRVMNNGDDNTMSVTDDHGNIAVFGRPDTLRKRGFSDADLMDFEDEDGVHKELMHQGIRPDTYTPFKKVVVPNR